MLRREAGNWKLRGIVQADVVDVVPHRIIGEIVVIFRKNTLYTKLPIGSMYGIFTYIYHNNQPNVGKYTIHGSYGLYIVPHNGLFIYRIP